MRAQSVVSLRPFSTLSTVLGVAQRWASSDAIKSTGDARPFEFWKEQVWTVPEIGAGCLAAWMLASLEAWKLVHIEKEVAR